MSDQPTERQKALGSLSDEISRTLGSMPLLEADAVLDEARRFSFTKTYSGYTDLAVRKVLDTSDTATLIAVILVGLTLDEAETVIAVVRRTLWPAHFATKPKTHFGRQFAAYVQGKQH
ncbi:MAG: hypothetical protein ACREFM_11630, partial [Hypericibacter sp.]